MDVQHYLADISLKTMSRVHRAIVQLSGGKILGSAFGMPVVELHTVGRNSGRPRSTMLTAPVIDGDRVVLVASKGGDDRDPDWYRNLLANPQVTVELGTETFPATAVPVTGPERDTIYAEQGRRYPGFAEYQAKTDRVIPVVELIRAS